MYSLPCFIKYLECLRVIKSVLSSGMQTLQEKIKVTRILFTEVPITYKVMILFSRLEKAKKHNRYISQRLKEFQKRSSRRQEIMKVNILVAYI
jgi:hypothetical protein